MSSTTSLAALFLDADQPLQLRELPLPQPQSGEALVRIDCCTICGSDLHTVTGARREPAPSILGHEIIGTVTDVSRSPLADIDGQPLQPGDRVTWSTCVSCGDCDRCRGGIPQKCRRLSKYGHELAQGRTALSGGLAQFILLRAGTTAIKADHSVPDEVLCPVNCATATVAAAFRTAGPIDGKRVLIFGAGLLGLTAAAFARASDAGRIVVCDLDESRLELAKAFGADGVAKWHDDPALLREQFNLTSDEFAKFDVIIELSGAPAAVEAACDDLGDVGARIILVGSVMDSRPVRFDPQVWVRGWHSVHGVHNYAPEDLRTAVNFLQRNHERFPFRDLVQPAWPLTQVNEAIQSALESKPVRVAIRP